MPAFDMTTLIGRTVRLDRGGPESKQGQVLAVSTDHVVLKHEKEGVLYYQTAHIKSISVNTKVYPSVASSEPPAETLAQAQAPTPYIAAASFHELLTKMQGQWVQINRGGPENVQGVMTEVGDDYSEVVVNHELLIVMIEHMKSISYVVKQEKQQDGNQDANKNEEKKESSESKQDK